MVRRRLDLRSLRAQFDFEELEKLLASGDTGDRFLIFVQCALRFFASHEVPRFGLPTWYVDDLMQDVWLHVWPLARPAWAKGIEPFLAWLSRVTRNAAADAARRERSVRGTESKWSGTHRLRSVHSDTDGAPDIAEEQIPSPDEDPVTMALAVELSERITRALRQLPRRHRLMVVRWVIRGESLDAIALRFQISRRTTQREVMDALGRLKALVKSPRL